MKSMKRLLQYVLAGLLPCEFFLASSHEAQAQTRAIQFANSFEQPITVKLVGLITRATEIPSQHMRALQVSPGEYAVWIRCGNAPELYMYFRGDSVFVPESFAPDSTLTLVLSPDSSASYSLCASTIEEFEKIVVDSWQANELVAHTAPAKSTAAESSAVTIAEPRGDTTRVEPRLEKTMSRAAAADSQKIARATQILQEALTLTRNTKDKTERAYNLLALVPALEASLPDQAQAALDEAVVLIPQLPEKAPLINWGELFAGLAVAYLSRGNNTLPANSPWRVLQETSRRYEQYDYLQAETMARVKIKNDLMIRLVELLAPKGASRAMAFAQAIKYEGTRNHCLELALQHWPVSQRDSAAAIVRQLIAPSAQESPSSFLLLALAYGVANYDSALARELVHRVVKTSSLGANLWFAKQSYSLLANVDQAATRALGQKYLGTFSINRDEFLAFVESIASSRPEIAWQTLTAVDTTGLQWDAQRAALLRSLAPELRGPFVVQLKNYAEQLLMELPPPQEPRGMTFSYTGKMRDELRRLAAASDALVVLGRTHPELALQRARELQFNEFLAQTFFLERSGFLKLLPPQASGLNPKDKATKEKLERTFFRDLALLELALSWLKPNPKAAFEILASFNNSFWLALAYKALQGDMQLTTEKHPEFVDFNGRVHRMVAQVKTQWPEAAATWANAYPGSEIKTTPRLLEVCELFDRLAVAMFNKHKDYREGWWNYLPLALTAAGQTLCESDSTAAGKAFHTAKLIATALPSPAMEWAACLNATAWKTMGTAQAKEASKAAAKAVVSLKKHEPWEQSQALLSYYVAQLDAEAAIDFAKNLKEKSAQVPAMVNAAQGILDEASTARH